MMNTWALSALWVGLALAATLLAIWFKISTALSEIVVGTVAQLVIGVFIAQGGLAGNTQWITFLAGTGAIVLTFLAGAELDPVIFKTKWREASVIGLAGFFGPFLGCTAIAHYVLHWADHAQLAVRRRALHNLGCRGLCGDAGAWLQCDGVRQVDPRRVLHQRHRNRGCAGTDLLPIHHQDADLCGGLQSRSLWCCRFLRRGSSRNMAGAFPKSRPSTFFFSSLPWADWLFGRQ